MIVVGSGIMGERLAQGNTAVTLLVNSLATGAGLFVLIQCLGPISGAHLNPVVSLVDFFGGRLDRRGLFFYCFSQFLGAVVGIWIAHIMFDQSIIQISTRDRLGLNLWISEVIATLGLISTIILTRRHRPESTPMSVAAYITAAYWFTSSTSFANPAATLARMFTNTFCGISPAGVAPFVIAQIAGASLILIFLKNGRGDWNVITQRNLSFS